MIVKICGITDPGDATHALACGADWIGLNFVAGPRRIDWPAAQGILMRLDAPSWVVALVKVDRDPPDGELLSALRSHGVSRVQVYGGWSPATMAELACVGHEVVLPMPWEGFSTADRVDTLLSECDGDVQPAFILLDAAKPGQLGGTGERADWESIASARKAGRFDGWPPIILAGGLDVQNAAQAIHTVHPAGVDVSSGVETRLGRKDPALVEAMVRAVRASSE